MIYFGYELMSLFKYIMEKGIANLIIKYSKYRVEEIFDILINIDYITYYNLKTNKKMADREIKEFNIKVFCLTHDNFIIFEPSYFFNRNTHIEIHRIKIKNNKNMYVKILKDSINMNNKEFWMKYENTLNDITNLIIPTRILELSELLKYYDVEFYNIKACFYLSVPISDYVDFTNKNYIEYDCGVNKQSIANIFPKEQIIISKYYINEPDVYNSHDLECAINIHNLNL
jgi:hypothetical protein